MNDIDANARIIWDYMRLEEPLRPADVIFVMCSNDTRVAEHAAELYMRGLAPYVIFSGGVGRLTEGLFDTSEAQAFADIAVQLGVPYERIIIEDKSTNSGENVLFTKALLEEMGLDFQTFIIVQKPYMMRRAYATFKKRWPEKEAIPSSPNISFDDYPTKELGKNLIIHVLVGDLQRIKEYPAMGFQIPQDIPDNVWQAYQELVAAGYTDYLL